MVFIHLKLITPCIIICQLSKSGENVNDLRYLYKQCVTQCMLYWFYPSYVNNVVQLYLFFLFLIFQIYNNLSVTHFANLDFRSVKRFVILTNTSKFFFKFFSFKSCSIQKWAVLIRIHAFGVKNNSEDIDHRNINIGFFEYTDQPSLYRHSI